jgi:hypothetical protein
MAHHIFDLFGQRPIASKKRVGFPFFFFSPSRSLLVDKCELEAALVNKSEPQNSRRGGYIKGSINSTRHKSDKLYFERLDLSATYEDGSSIWRMDVEIVMVLISTTLSCVFVVLQIFHVKRHPDVLPLVSLVMLSVLTLGQLVPLVLNFEALFFRSSSRWSIMRESDGWLEAHEVMLNQHLF